MNISALKKSGHWPTLATSFLYFDVSFMVWTLLGALGSMIAPALGLNAQQKFLMVSTPILSGAFLRIAVSLLVDRIGTKRTGILAQLIVMLALAVAWQFGISTFHQALLLGVVLGLAGASFAVALPQSGRWYPPQMQGVVLGLAGTLVVGVLTELIALRTLYQRDHLDQVLATFGLILFFNELIAILWGRAAIFSTLPDYLQGHLELSDDLRYPLYRLVIIAVGLAVALALWFVVARTRLGMLIRAGASNRTMVAALGVNIRLLYTLVFGCGAALAGLAGIMAGPIYAVQPGMGELVLIQVFVVIVIGGIGSIRGALAGAVIVGVVDTLGRAFLKPLLATVWSPVVADTAGPALASMLIYLLMAIVLAVRPAGLFPSRA